MTARVTTRAGSPDRPSRDGLEGTLRMGTWYRMRFMAELGLLPTTGHVLDIGGRDGRMLSQLVAAGLTDATLVDIEVIPAHPEVSYARGSGLELPVRDSAVDAVMAFDVIEHVPDDEAFVAELVRVVRPGGTVILTTPADDIRLLPEPGQRWIDKQWGHDRVRGYSAGRLEELFAAAGVSRPHVLSVAMRAYRLGYFPMRALWGVAPALGRSLVAAAARFDNRHIGGGHGFQLLTATV